jgi:ribosomal protein S18 acetylase RimI-like enzyme
MTEIKYIQASAQHLPLLIDSRVEFLSEYWGKQDEQTENKLRAELKLFFEKEISAQTYISFLAMDGEKLVGIGGMKILQKPGSFRVPDGRCGYIMNMYTLPHYRRKGIGQTILDKMIEAGQAMGIRFFELHATQDGEPLYIKAEFQKHKEPTYRKFF